MCKAFLVLSVGTLLAIGTVHAQITPDPTSPQPEPTGIPLPSRTDVSPNHSLDTSRAAHRKPVKPPKEPNYDNKSVNSKGKLTKETPIKADEKDLPKK